MPLAQPAVGKSHRNPSFVPDEDAIASVTFSDSTIAAATAATMEAKTSAE